MHRDDLLRSLRRLRDGLELDWGLAVAQGKATAGLAGPHGRERYGVHGGPVPEVLDLSRRSGGAWLDERSAGAAASPFAVQITEAGARLMQGPEAPPPDPSLLGFSPGEKLA